LYTLNTMPTVGNFRTPHFSAQLGDNIRIFQGCASGNFEVRVVWDLPSNEQYDPNDSGTAFPATPYARTFPVRTTSFYVFVSMTVAGTPGDAYNLSVGIIKKV
jgi:hypothetical protein